MDLYHDGLNKKNKDTNIGINIMKIESVLKYAPFNLSQVYFKEKFVKYPVFKQIKRTMPMNTKYLNSCLKWKIIRLYQLKVAFRVSILWELSMKLEIFSNT